MDQEEGQSVGQTGQSADQSGQPTGQQAQAQHQNKTVMGILAYLGILILIPFIVAKDDPFVKFHIKQGLVVFIIDLIVWFGGYSILPWSLWPLLQLFNLCILVLVILGIVNVVNGKQQELPVVGSLAHYFTF